jgi:gentisate 1,2-dioxygenase
MESLLWQENLKKPAALLGSEAGFETNRSKEAA